MSELNTMVDKIFIINLQNRKDKYKRIVKQLHHLNITNYERLDAIRPSDNMIRSNPFLSTLNNNSIYGRGVIGCKMSHIKAIRKSKERGYEKVLILEDDAEFHPDFPERIKQVNKQLQTLQWDMLYLGANHESKGIPLTDNIKRCYQAFTTSSYIIKSNVYDLVLEKAIPYTKEIDVFYVDVVQSHKKVLGVFPNLITQFKSKSDISGNTAEYDFKNC